ncbi:TPA: hypothetical protein ACX6RV_000651 [Photobacterium damselae]
MKSHIQVLQYLIDNPTLSWVGSSSDICVEAFKELHDKGLVKGIDASGDTSESFEFLNPEITLEGRIFLANLNTKL